jgi:hypothetical protein
MDIADFDLSDADAAAFCPSCGAGYAAGRSRCEDCDLDLLPRSEIEAARAGTEAPSAPESEVHEPIEAPPEFDLSDPDAVAFCPSCGSGYRAGPLVCVDCETALRPRSWAETQRELVSDPTVDQVVLADVESSFKADVLGSALHDQGVWFVTQPTGSPALRFLVHPVDLDLARQVLSDIDELEPLDEG